MSDTLFRFFGTPSVVHASGQLTHNAYGIVEQLAAEPGFATPLHVHTREDESFYIIEGEVAFILDGKWQRANAGSFVYGPRNIPHGFKITGNKPARLLIFAAPSGFEQFVLELATPLNAPPAPPDLEKLVATAATYGIQILGPLPDSPAEMPTVPVATLPPA
jgi:quercetin dioxygenase-like cupin family protein